MEKNKTNTWLVINGLLIMSISGVMGWLFNSVIFTAIGDLSYRILLGIPGAVVWFIPVTLVNLYGVKVLKGESKYFTSLDSKTLQLTTFVVFTVSLLFSLIFFQSRFNDLFASGITEGQTFGYIITMIISYLSAILIDYYKKNRQDNYVNRG